MDTNRKRFRPDRTGIGRPLGELEAAIMQLVWANDDTGCLGADIQRHLQQTSGRTALTTVLTTLDRLYDKGIVRRMREGKAYRYYAALSQEALEQQIVEDVLDSVIERFPQAVVNYFSQAGGNTERLLELARQIEALQRKDDRS